MGLYEHQAKEKNIAIDTYTHRFHDVDRAILEGEDHGFVNIHVNKKRTGKIVGATIVARSVVWDHCLERIKRRDTGPILRYFLAQKSKMPGF